MMMMMMIDGVYGVRVDLMSVGCQPASNQTVQLDYHPQLTSLQYYWAVKLIFYFVIPWRMKG